MATTYKVLGQVNPTAETNTTLYTVPLSNSTVCSTITICNLDVSATYRVAIRPNGATLENKHYIAYDAAVNQYETVMLTIGLTLAENDVITVRSSTGNTAFQVFGSEIA